MLKTLVKPKWVCGKNSLCENFELFCEKTTITFEIRQSAEMKISVYGEGKKVYFR